MKLIGNQLQTGRRSSQAGEDSARQRHTHALPDDAARCQEAGRAALVTARSRTHQLLGD